MPTVGPGKNRETDRIPAKITLGRVAKLLRRRGGRTPVRLHRDSNDSNDFHEGDIFICLARRDTVEVIPLGGGALSPTEPLSAREKSALKHVGIRPPASDAVTKSIRKSANTYVAILNSSLTVEAAADHLKVNQSRIRQRLGADPPSLHGFKLSDGWRLPDFQFDTEGEIPGLAEVVGALSQDLDPVSVSQWFVTPNTDLTLDDDETCVSPRDWLRARRLPSQAAILARNL